MPVKHNVHKQESYNHALMGLFSGATMNRDTNKLEGVQRRAPNRGKF